MRPVCERHPTMVGLERWHRGLNGQSPCLLMNTFCLACWRAEDARGVAGIQLANGNAWSPRDPFLGLASPPPLESPMPKKVDRITVPIEAPPRAPTIDLLAEGGEAPQPRKSRLCSSCGKYKVKAKDLCSGCYERQRHERAAKQMQRWASERRIAEDAAAPTPTDEHTGIDLAQVRQSVQEGLTDAAVRQAALAALERVIGRWPDAVPMAGRAKVELILARVARGLTP